MTVMLRTLLSEGQIDRWSPFHNATARRRPFMSSATAPFGDVTSARENVDQEMLTRLITSDADESREQTLAVVERRWIPSQSWLDKSEVGRWLHLQRRLEFGAPYDVVIPFAKAAWKAHRALIDQFPESLQLRSGATSAVFLPPSRRRLSCIRRGARMMPRGGSWRPLPTIDTPGTPSIRVCRRSME